MWAAHPMMFGNIADLTTFVAAGWLAPNAVLYPAAYGGSVGDMLLMSSPQARPTYGGGTWTLFDYSWSPFGVAINATCGWLQLPDLNGNSLNGGGSAGGTAWALYRGPTTASINIVDAAADGLATQHIVTIPAKNSIARANALVCHQGGTASNANAPAGFSDRFHGLNDIGSVVFDLLDTFAPPAVDTSATITGISGGGNASYRHLVIGFELRKP